MADNASAYDYEEPQQPEESPEKEPEESPEKEPEELSEQQPEESPKQQPEESPEQQPEESPEPRLQRRQTMEKKEGGSLRAFVRSEWEEKIDPYGKMYYYNNETEFKMYEKPSGWDEASPLKVGDRVILQGLKKNPSLNGLKGSIIKLKPKNKYDIKLDNGDGRNNISIKYLKKGVPKVSKKSSYYFFKTTNAEQAKQYLPTKISPQKIEKNSEKKIGLSHWNQRGATWEDRDLADWSHKTIRSLFSNLKVDADSSEIILDVEDVSGDASVVYTRGQVRIGFELQIKGTARGEYCGSEVNAKFEIPEVDENSFKEDDYELEIKNVPGAVKKKLLKSLRPAVQSTFKTFVEEMNKEAIST